MRAWLLAIVVWFASLAPQAALADDPYVGEIRTFAFNFCPAGWVPLNGQLLAISEYDTVFTLIGTRYGGDGQSTFAMPVGEPIFSATGEPLLQCFSLYGIYPSQN
jgi:hypothetical protein